MKKILLWFVAVIERRETIARLKKANGMLIDHITEGNCVNNRKNKKRWHYCDQCPLADIGGDHFHKTRPTREDSKTMCSRSRWYSN